MTTSTTPFHHRPRLRREPDVLQDIKSHA